MSSTVSPGVSDDDQQGQAAQFLLRGRPELVKFQHMLVGDVPYYFAYGSNMSPATFVERRGMRPLATRWGRIAGYRLCFDLPIGPGERGCANVEPAVGTRVAGVLYNITQNDAELLDRTEGVPQGIYRRRGRHVTHWYTISAAPKRSSIR